MPAPTDARSRQDAFTRAIGTAVRANQGSGAVPDAAAVRVGLPLDTLDGALRAVGLSADALGGVLDVSARTLQRRRASGDRLTPAESDRLWRVLHVDALARRAFGDDAEAARVWLTSPKALLGGETPLQRLDTEPGLREVEDMLTVVDETAAA